MTLGQSFSVKTMSITPDREIYPMPMFVTLTVKDFQRSEKFFHAAGFITLATVPDPQGNPAVLHLRRLRNQDLLLVQQDNTESETHSTAPASVQVSFSTHQEDLDQLALCLESAVSGCAEIEKPQDTLWFTRDLVVTDPDGHRIIFTQQRRDDAADATRWAETFS
ncbi:Glyoxalase/bleomycin resistance protein/dioxygenase [Corynebacterium pseudotuberculosis]|nr:Glyoxalase/bleomycin resistance protein/dioxygenase [Corynebacterium pseudotuberculosis]APQ56613.1 Glyoxalase/bleomycin resistance protein/dioxygenase [Corynebacterium pseudotuberculosis]ATB62393.1 Glyoxalase/bleomycin resistance protein/dioxygenase [Corynebacterium pseudotuberculosis]ATV80289.1 Glyoxalase/bleomycin resistance protein/dioxygenase [Corynebacterium pseudotuberculosis]AUY60897.1 Glyoxalase/bleomycin resistance protein/dioxygenase [Corynebacterium pseudotuberculosis]